MDRERDVTDLGILPALSAAELAEIARLAAERKRAARRRDEVGDPNRPSASERVIDRARSSSGFARSRRSQALLASCPTCRASVRSWCRGRFGRLCAARIPDEE